MNQALRHAGASFPNRAVLLQEHGWTEKQFEAVELRIQWARSTLRRSKKPRLENSLFKEELAMIRANPRISDARRPKLIACVKSEREKVWRRINGHKPDWPAVKFYRAELEQLA